MSEPARVVTVGMQRSGTTLFATLLRAQPETSFLPDYLGSFLGAMAATNASWRSPLKAPARRTALAMVRDELLRFGTVLLLEADSFRTIDDLHREALRQLGGAGLRVVGHKMLLSPSGIERLLDETDVTAVLLLRDPRDAASSAQVRFGGGVERFVEEWRALASLARSHGTHPRLVVLRFEDLVAAPDAALARLGDALGIAFAPVGGPRTFVGRGGRESAWRENSSFGDLREDVDPAAIGRWRSCPDSPVVRYAAFRCGDLLEGFGYERGPRLGRVERGRLASHYAAHRLANGLEGAGQRLSTIVRRTFGELEPRGASRRSP